MRIFGITTHRVIQVHTKTDWHITGKQAEVCVLPFLIHTRSAPGRAAARVGGGKVFPAALLGQLQHSMLPPMMVSADAPQPTYRALPNSYLSAYQQQHQRLTTVPHDHLEPHTSHDFKTQFNSSKTKCTIVDGFTNVLLRC